MYESILKTIKDHFYSVNGTPEKSAREIADRFERFNDWCIINTYKMYNSNWYGICDIDLTFDTINELWNYWLTNIETK